MVSKVFFALFCVDRRPYRQAQNDVRTSIIPSDALDLVDQLFRISIIFSASSRSKRIVSIAFFSFSGLYLI